MPVSVTEATSTKDHLVCILHNPESRTKNTSNNRDALQRPNQRIGTAASKMGSISSNSSTQSSCGDISGYNTPLCSIEYGHAISESLEEVSRDLESNDNGANTARRSNESIDNVNSKTSVSVTILEPSTNSDNIRKNKNYIYLRSASENSNRKNLSSTRSSSRSSSRKSLYTSIGNRSACRRPASAYVDGQNINVSELTSRLMPQYDTPLTIAESKFLGVKSVSESNIPARCSSRVTSHSARSQRETTRVRLPILTLSIYLKKCSHYR
ncbi:hypothetical protein SNE40_003481 [Patella caerulea]|uniref:Uncharacterized protein n=1 Tax=Patella caerulea TaxID=87958 RepID=A0AAN8KI89_PATCE